MTTLILSPFFFPELISTGKYNTILAQGLVAAGQEVVVFASHPLYPKWKAEVSIASLPSITIERGGAWLRYPRSAMLRRLVLECWYTVFACIQYLRLRTKPDYVVPIFPPSLFFLVLSMLTGRSAALIGIVHDLQGVYAKRSKSLIGRLLQAGIQWVERRCFSRCHRLVFLAQAMADRAIQEYGLDPARCEVCYPFVGTATTEAKLGVGLAPVLPEQWTHVVYSGALGDKQNPDGLFAFMNALSQCNSHMKCHIFSAGPHFERLKAASLTRQNCAVTFHDLVPADLVEELYARSSVQIIPQADGTADGSLPSKLPNLLAAGVPIFAICESKSELGFLVKKAGAGVVAESWAISELTTQFDKMLTTLSTETRAARQARQRAFVQENFSIDAVVNAILH
jgi:colanic acid biosynthesis glycosyl transferase WcaI